ncbi:MAG: hypothetical protein NXI21_12835 [Alphaproteobacteria bacterium]|nr:hypothetical protein [Alphaproteobacteria bacterium]
MTPTGGRDAVPPDFTEFPEEDRVRDGPMRDEILTMVVEALNRQGQPDLTAESVRRNPAHREAALDMLRDCRPMPVVLALIAEIEAERDGP